MPGDGGTRRATTSPSSRARTAALAHARRPSPRPPFREYGGLQNAAGRPGAHAADQTLSNDGDERAAHEERLDAEVDEASDGRCGVVRVQRREHEVARERGLDPDLGRLEVANLTDHDDVRVLTQEGAQRRGDLLTLMRLLRVVYPELCRRARND